MRQWERYGQEMALENVADPTQLADVTFTETSWKLGPFAAMLAPGHTSPQATKYKETIRD